MPWTDAFLPVEHANYVAVQEATWGHLAPEKGRTYTGSMLFTQSEYGDIVVIRANFEGLDDSPWLFEALNNFAADHAIDPGAIYLFRGTFRNYRFRGPVSKLDLPL